MGGTGRVYTPEEAKRVIERGDIPESIVLKALGLSPPLSAEEQAQLDACSTPSDAWDVYENALANSELERLALVRAEELSRSVLTRTTAFEEARDVYLKAPYGSELGCEAIRRMVDLSSPGG